MVRDRRRRARRRQWAQRLVPLASAGVVIAIVVGGFAQIPRLSRPYDRTLNQSFAALARPIVGSSNATGTQVRHLIGQMASLTRPALQRDLDSVVFASRNEAIEASDVARDSAPSDLSRDFVDVIDGRARAVSELRAAVYGLLGMTPAPVAGTAQAASAAPAPVIISGNRATFEIGQSGTTLLGADATYRALRHRLASAAGHEDLAASVWIPDAQLFATGPVLTMVDQLTTSPTLAVRHDVQLLVVGVFPAAIPRPGTQSASLLPPTNQLGVSAVVTNLGDVNEPTVQLTATITEVGSAEPSLVVERTLALAPSTSQAVSLPPIDVHPGETYMLTVAVAPPTAQADRTGLSQSSILQIAASTGALT